LEDIAAGPGLAANSPFAMSAEILSKVCQQALSVKIAATVVSAIFLRGFPAVIMWACL